MPPYDSLNLGAHCGDNPEHVEENRNRLFAAGNLPSKPVWLEQVHGKDVLKLSGGPYSSKRADASWSNTPGTVCAVMTADCLPVLFCNRAGTEVAAAHAGWRGLAGTQGRGVIETTLEAARGLAGTFGRGDILAWLGPCIGPAAFEVGPEVQAAFCAHDPAAQACFQPAPGPGKLLADLPALARQRLRAQGVLQVHGNDGSPAWCTVTQESRFFSHRRDAVRLGSTGRMAACIWLG